MFLEQAFIQCTLQQKKLRVLDLCGAPGGKATHLSSLIGENGLLVSNEVIRSRASVLAENITKWGSSNTIVTNNDPSEFKRVNGFFDVILADAPCSGEGMFRDAVAVNQWSEENAIHCSERQKRILMDVWPALKQDGILIYSTCTFNPAENEKNIKWLAGREETESFKLDISEFPGVQEISYEGITGYGFYPGKIRGDGFFMAVVRKKGPSGDMRPGARRSKDPGLNNTDLAAIREWLVFKSENLIKSGNEIENVADISDFKILRDNLRLIKNGTTICTVKNRDYIPSHELALSTGLKKKAFPCYEAGYDLAISFLRRDNFKAPDAPVGWFLMKYKGVTLGFANNLGSRINNYFPVGWRIRMTGGDDSMDKIIKWD